MADYNPTRRTRLQSDILREAISDIADSNRGSSADFNNDVADVTSDLFDLLIRKHKDYGPKNISLSPGGPLNGLRVRMWDKLARINNLVDTGAKPENESLEDSFKDMANYAIIGLLVLQGKWPNE
jgi:hypothetical protein